MSEAPFAARMRREPARDRTEACRPCATAASEAPAASAAAAAASALRDVVPPARSKRDVDARLPAVADVERDAVGIAARSVRARRRGRSSAELDDAHCAAARAAAARHARHARRRR